ncbi:MAG: hypothetical protein JST92_15990 [Deltaproteobacteria bacterium]|nr:hypothetical protein [Deltaproteobacteria bacterium]
MRTFFVALAIAVCGLLALHARAADAPKAAAELDVSKVTAADLGWLAGRWTGEREGAFIEETWSPPQDGMLAGHARELEGGKVRELELSSIETEDGKPVLRFAHFGAGLQAKRAGEILTWKLLKAGAQSALFEGVGPIAGERIGYTRVDENTLHIVGEFRRGEKLVEFKFVYTRASR